VLNALRSHSALTRALIDPTTQEGRKSTLIDVALAGVGGEARQVIREGTERTWDSTREFLAWVEASRVRQAWEWAAEDGILAQSIDDVFAFGQLMLRDNSVRTAITDRRLPVEGRQELIGSVLSSSMTGPAVEVARAAVATPRGTIDDAVTAFLNIGTEIAGGMLAAVTVAKPMSQQQSEQLREALEARLGVKIILQQVVDPSIMGGVRVECGAEVIDATVTSRLEAVRRDFA